MLMINACDEVLPLFGGSLGKDVGPYVLEKRRMLQDELLSLFLADHSNNELTNKQLKYLNELVGKVLVLRGEEFVSIYMKYLPEIEDELAGKYPKAVDVVEIIHVSHESIGLKFHRFHFNESEKLMNKRWSHEELPHELFKEVYADEIKEYNK